MQSKARLHDVSYTADGKPRYSFDFEDKIDLSDLFDKELEIDVQPYKKKRSSDANRYFHRLARLIATARTVRGDATSEVAEKNELVAKYGVRETLDDEPIAYKTNAPPEYMKEIEEPHTWFWKMSEDGQYFYKVYAKTRGYNTAQMSELIEGAVQDARDWGVPEREILTPDKQAELLQRWQIALSNEQSVASSAEMKENSNSITVSTEEPTEN